MLVGGSCAPCGCRPHALVLEQRAARRVASARLGVELVTTGDYS